MHYKQDLNRAANESEKQKIYEKRKAEGVLKGIVDLIEARYGISEEEWALSLNVKQLKAIDKIIFEEDEYDLLLVIKDESRYSIK